MTIIANGDSFELENGTTLPRFVESLNLALTRVVVEHNGNALSPSDAQNCVLRDGDQLEIVRIVAGG